MEHFHSNEFFTDIESDPPSYIRNVANEVAKRNLDYLNNHDNHNSDNEEESKTDNIKMPWALQMNLPQGDAISIASEDIKVNSKK